MLRTFKRFTMGHTLERFGFEMQFGDETQSCDTRRVRG